MVRVVVVVVVAIIIIIGGLLWGWPQVKVNLDPWSLSPLQPHLSLIIFFRVGSIVSWSNISSGNDQFSSDQISLWGGISSPVIKFIFQVQSVALRSEFSLGWDLLVYDWATEFFHGSLLCILETFIVFPFIISSCQCRRSLNKVCSCFYIELDGSRRPVQEDWQERRACQGEEQEAERVAQIHGAWSHDGRLQYRTRKKLLSKTCGLEKVLDWKIRRYKN